MEIDIIYFFFFHFHKAKTIKRSFYPLMKYLYLLICISIQNIKVIVSLCSV